MFFQLDHLQGIDLALEQPAHGGMVGVIALIFQAMDLNQAVVQVLQLAALAGEVHCLAAPRSAANTSVSVCFLNSGAMSSMWYRLEPFGQGIDGIDDVVQLAYQVVDVLAVERGDKCPIQPIQRLVRRAVSVVLLLADPLHMGDRYPGNCSPIRAGGWRCETT